MRLLVRTKGELHSLFARGECSELNRTSGACEPLNCWNDPFTRFLVVTKAGGVQLIRTLE